MICFKKMSILYAKRIVVQGCQVQKMKKAKFDNEQFQKGQILKNEKRPNKGHIRKFVKVNYNKFLKS